MLTFIDKKTTSPKLSRQLLIASLLTLGLAACNDSYKKETAMLIIPAEPVMEYSYSITLTNLTYAQPLSPIAIALHDEGKMWQVGQPASIALEKLAEGGNNSDFMSLENNLATTTSEDALPPGDSVTLELSTTEPMANYLTIATMLVNTNDAFSGLTGIDISTLVLNQEKSWSLSVYDSGTELNSEAVGTIPGPADGGVGYDATRNDIDVVGYHSGVVSKDDGLSSSVLTQAHRFDNPAVKVTITRTK